jgi:hypothetical protein
VTPEELAEKVDHGSQLQSEAALSELVARATDYDVSAYQHVAALLAERDEAVKRAEAAEAERDKWRRQAYINDQPNQDRANELLAAVIAKTDAEARIATLTAALERIVRYSPSLPDSRIYECALAALHEGEKP